VGVGAAVGFAVVAVGSVGLVVVPVVVGVVGFAVVPVVVGVVVVVVVDVDGLLPVDVGVVVPEVVPLVLVPDVVPLVPDVLVVPLVDVPVDVSVLSVCFLHLVAPKRTLVIRIITINIVISFAVFVFKVIHPPILIIAMTSI